MSESEQWVGLCHETTTWKSDETIEKEMDRACRQASGDAYEQSYTGAASGKAQSSPNNKHVSYEGTNPKGTCIHAWTANSRFFSLVASAAHAREQRVPRTAEQKNGTSGKGLHTSWWYAVSARWLMSSRKKLAWSWIGLPERCLLSPGRTASGTISSGGRSGSRSIMDSSPIPWVRSPRSSISSG